MTVSLGMAVAVLGALVVRGKVTLGATTMPPLVRTPITLDRVEIGVAVVIPLVVGIGVAAVTGVVVAVAILVGVVVIINSGCQVFTP